MAIIVQKYGGSSVGTTEKIKQVAKTIAARKEQGDDLVVVVSAMGDTTDHLIALAKAVSPTPDRRELDALLSTGEMVSCALLAMAIQELGQEAVSYSAYQVGIKTSGQYGKSLIDDIDESKIQESLKDGKVVIIAGFQGVNEEGDITTLGRGGSDTTAAAIAVKLNGICEIYTDVDGIYNADPRKYKNAKKLSEIEYEEMLELASLGAQVMHSRSIELGQKYGIPIYVGLSNGERNGTMIKGAGTMNMEEKTEMGIITNMEQKAVTGMTTSNDDVIITMENIQYDIHILSNLFEEVGSRKINIDMISQTAPMNGKVNISFTIPQNDIQECLKVCETFAPKEKINIDEDITKFSLVGLGMKTTTGVAAKLFKIFSENEIQVKMITTSEIRITCGIKREDELRAIDLVGRAFEM